MTKTIVISGGSQGLGKAMAAKLCPENKVIILSEDEEKLKQTAQELGCDCCVCDVTKPEDVKKAVDYALGKYGKIDCLINNAGIWLEGEIDDNDPERIRKTLEVNTLGTMLLSREVIPAMKREKKGLIINIISQAGVHARPGYVVYSASKWGITGFTRSIEKDLAKDGIRVTGIYPGLVKTNIFKNAGYQDEGMENALDPDVVAELVRFVVSFDAPVLFTDLGLKNINQPWND